MWILDGKEVHYCLSKIVPQHCKLMFSVHILIAVIACNAVKCLSMIWLICTQRESTFVTFGDGLSSWLRQPDRVTKNGPPWKSRITSLRYPRDASYLCAISLGQWGTTMIIFSSVVLFTALGLGMGIPMLSPDDNIISAGFGATNNDMAFYRSGNLATMVIITNAPQVLWTFVYLVYNALLTNMHFTHELTAYKLHRKTLRVTTPYGEQRNTYTLQLPLTIGLPLMLGSSAVHWLISQAIFLVNIEGGTQSIKPFSSLIVGDSDSQDSTSPAPTSESQGITSIAPMLVILVITVCMMVVAIGLGFRKHAGDPLIFAASNSFALAAAAHRPSNDVDAAVLPVKWGRVVGDGDSVGRCCFTSKEVR